MIPQLLHLVIINCDSGLTDSMPTVQSNTVMSLPVSTKLTDHVTMSPSSVDPAVNVPQEHRKLWTTRT